MSMQSTRLASSERTSLEHSAAIFFIVSALVLSILSLMSETERIPPVSQKKNTLMQRVAHISTALKLNYSFNTPGTLHESASKDESSSPYWWLDSGAKLHIYNGLGETVQGALAFSDPWRAEYLATNSEDTESGRHPQNIFRLVSRSSWENARVESSFYIVRDNLSLSKNRNESNGLLLMSRYRDEGQTLYYAGIRVDGTAVIKKKYKGTYFTMAQLQFLNGTYALSSHPNLLPHRQWIRLRADTITRPDKSVVITLSMKNDAGEWQKLVSATDAGEFGGSPPIYGTYPVGIRTDFMDVRFDNFLAEKL